MNNFWNIRKTTTRECHSIQCILRQRQHCLCLCSKETNKNHEKKIMTNSRNMFATHHLYSSLDSNFDLTWKICNSLWVCVRLTELHFQRIKRVIRFCSFVLGHVTAILHQIENRYCTFWPFITHTKNGIFNVSTNELAGNISRSGLCCSPKYQMRMFKMLTKLWKWNVRLALA